MPSLCKNNMESNKSDSFEELSNESSSKLVVSRGNPRARFMVVGEAPGAKEDLLTKPFVGRSGKLLDKLLESAGFNVENDIYFCNVIKCKPPGNRKPTRIEIKNSIPWLYQQILLVDPFILALAGSTAVQSVLGTTEPISSLRGKWINWNDRLVMPIFHPSYLLRNPSKVEGSPTFQTMNDMENIYKRLEITL
tara:strand:+ start:171 stop:749 length:579 start_codon:yes stop_codon:yes gene_type:complete